MHKSPTNGQLTTLVIILLIIGFSTSFTVAFKVLLIFIGINLSILILTTFIVTYLNSSKNINSISLHEAQLRMSQKDDELEELMRKLMTTDDLILRELYSEIYDNTEKEYEYYLSIVKKSRS